MKNHLFHLSATLAILLLAGSAADAHDHLAAGVADTNGNGHSDIGEPLELVGASISGNIYHLLENPASNQYGGGYFLDERPRTLYPNDSFTFTVLSTGVFDAPSPVAPKAGSWIWMAITAVVGPAGAHFGFWDDDWSLTHNTPTQSFLTNNSTGDYKFILSEGTDDPGEDPQGHIHNRAWTADTPGDYYVTFVLYDMGHQGPGGGPLHPQSQPYTFHFQAVPEPSCAVLLLSAAAFGAARRRRVS